MAGHRSPYETLSVSPDAEPIVIEAAYKALIKKYHPDLWVHDPDAQGRAATINHAFAILRNPETRLLCDQQLRAMRNATQAASLRPTRPRTRDTRWWTGWLVALIVAAGLLVPWNEISIPTVELTSRSAPTRAAAVIAETEAAKPRARAERATRPEKPLPDGLVQLLAKAREQQNTFLASLDESAAPAEQSTGRSAQRHSPGKRKQERAPPAADSQAQSDFLEREGYIY